MECIIHTDMAEMKSLRNRLSRHMDDREIANGQNCDRLVEETPQKTTEDSK